MNSAPEDFERLRRLLALKRHEQPPPGYFHSLPRQIASRIRAGDEGAPEMSWFQRVWSMLESKPAFAAMFGAAVCVVLISGIVNSDQGGGVAPVATQPTSAFPNPTPVALNDWSHGQSIASTNPISDLFNQLQLRAEPASLNFGYPGGGN
jgi:hypothetical protein